MPLKIFQIEYPILILCSILGMMVMISGHSLLIQYSTSFRSLSCLISKVVQMIKKSGYTDLIISKERFIDCLKVLGNIDWLNPRIKTTYVGSGEPPWQSLCQWMSDTLSRGKKNLIQNLK